jgi:cell division topological specificity factor
MAGLFERLFGWARGREEKEVGSGQLAKDRLQLVLVQDRVKLPAAELQAMQEEMIAVISKYVSVDMDNVDFNVSNRDRNGLLVAEIPFISLTDEDPPPKDLAEALAEAVQAPTMSEDDYDHDPDTVVYEELAETEAVETSRTVDGEEAEEHDESSEIDAGDMNEDIEDTLPEQTATESVDIETDEEVEPELDDDPSDDAKDS